MKEFIFSSDAKGLKIAVLHEGQPQSFYFQSSDSSCDFDLDDIICGRVIKARQDFIWFDIGSQQEAVGKRILFPKTVSEGDLFWLQISRVPWPEASYYGKTEKGYRVSPHIAIGGRYWVYKPFASSKWIQRSIQNDESELSPNILIEQEKMTQNFAFLNSKPVFPFHFPLLKDWQKQLRDINENDTRIVCQTPYEQKIVYQFLQNERPKLLSYVRLARQHEIPLFESTGVQDVWDNLFQPTVLIQNGIYLDIRELPAATLIDINAGKSQDSFYQINVQAWPYVLNQILWRGLSGNIFIDFLRLSYDLQIKLRKTIEMDLQSTHIKSFGFCELGLFQLQRPRLKPSLALQLSTPCGHCLGSGFLPSDL